MLICRLDAVARTPSVKRNIANASKQGESVDNNASATTATIAIEESLRFLHRLQTKEELLKIWRER